jgi:hypothetical protein
VLVAFRELRSLFSSQYVRDLRHHPGMLYFHLDLDSGASFRGGTEGGLVKGAAHRISGPLLFMQGAHLFAKSLRAFVKALMDLLNPFLLRIRQVQTGERSELTGTSKSSRAMRPMPESTRSGRRSIGPLRRILRKDNGRSHCQNNRAYTGNDRRFFPIQLHVNTPSKDCSIKSEWFALNLDL